MSLASPQRREQLRGGGPVVVEAEQGPVVVPGDFVGAAPSPWPWALAGVGVLAGGALILALRRRKKGRRT